MGMLDIIKVTAVMMIFFSSSMTVMTYTLAYIGDVDANSYTDIFSSVSTEYSKKNITDTMTSQIQSQKQIPLIEMGALLFYSGNFMIDLCFNFIFAIPQMIGLILSGVALLFNVDPDLMYMLQVYLMGVMGMLYIISIIQMIMGIRTQSGSVL